MNMPPSSTSSCSKDQVVGPEKNKNTMLPQLTNRKTVPVYLTGTTTLSSEVAPGDVVKRKRSKEESDVEDVHLVEQVGEKKGKSCPPEHEQVQKLFSRRVNSQKRLSPSTLSASLVKEIRDSLATTADQQL